MSLIRIQNRGNQFAKTARTSPSRFDEGSDAPPKSESHPATKEHKQKLMIMKHNDNSLPFTSKQYLNKHSRLTPRMSMERIQLKQELNQATKDNLAFKSYIFGINAAATQRNLIKGSPEEQFYFEQLKIITKIENGLDKEIKQQHF